MKLFLKQLIRLVKTFAVYLVHKKAVFAEGIKVWGVSIFGTKW